MSKNLRAIRESIESLRKLGLPAPTLLSLDNWLRDEEIQDKIDKCDHAWTDATNIAVSGTAYCPKCESLEFLSNVKLTHHKEE